MSFPPRALLAVPGDLATPTGGYGYARRLLEAAPGQGVILRHWPLPGGFPEPSAEVLAETARRLSVLPAGWPVIVDGLAMGTLAPEVLTEAGVPVIALCHHPLGLETGLAPARAERLIASERAALGVAEAVIATSETTAGLLRERFAVAPERIAVAPPGTDPAPRARGSAGAGCEILSVGSLTPRKGHDVLIDALARLSGLDWQLTVVGAEPDPEHRATLERQIAASGLSGRVRLAGACAPDRLAELYDSADLFALASRYEGYGMAYAEALARGLPVVGCDAGAVAEATRGGATLVAPDDAEGLARALAPLIGQPATRAAAAGRAAEAALGLPRWEDTAARVGATLSAVLAGAPAAGAGSGPIRDAATWPDAARSRP